MSNDGFRLLREKSLLYTQKKFIPKYKLKAIMHSAVENNVQVNHFYCQPKEKESSDA